ncbi:hypothetical protein QE364_003308 [Nocardioides zeae]|uniref:DUF2877 domain-containing protein n=2 Tax=Nocardioides zeae TaxID=1457234 RepID=A0AAJ1U0T9_9ACTN|nr:DUF2877 domain-containing protein [Nocardioides zeae]MDQ1105284.1 hypothetical protein [Nocardioides zeae]MDR6175002.1 hypothetical protein [Nocardioides zeae]MDR6211580.1 hypothetical protein [Nocardioides zeae]
MTSAADADLALGARVAARPRELRVALTARAAAYLVDAGTGQPVCALVDHDAVVVPDAVRLPRGVAWEQVLAARSTHPILLGDGALRCDDVVVPVRAHTDSRLRTTGLDAADPATAARRLAAARDRVTARTAATHAPWPAVDHTWTGGLATPAALALDAPTLIGRGPGLTPTGDDLCSGVLLVHRLLGTPGTDAAAAVVLDLARTRTTTASRLLLAAAAEGRATPAVRRVLTTLLAPGPEVPEVTGALGDLDHHVAALLALGHTSGADLADGIRDGLLAVAGSRSLPSPVPSTERNCA